MEAKLSRRILIVRLVEVITINNWQGADFLRTNNMYMYVCVSVCEQTPIECCIVCTHNCAMSHNIFTSRNNLAIAHNPSIRVSHRCSHLKVRNRYSS